METKIYIDPGQHKPRPWLGVETRTVITIGILVVALLPVLYLAWRFDLPTELVGFVCLAAGIGIGTLGISKRHGLHAEEWIPLWWEDLKAPEELAWHAPVVALYSPAQAPSKAQVRLVRRNLRAARAARKEEATMDNEFALEFAGLDKEGES